MESYNLNRQEGKHTVLVKLQKFDFSGCIYDTILGPCKGRDILDFDFENWTNVEENDCNCKENNGLFSATLTNESGNNIEVFGDAQDFNNMIVKIEIVNFN